MKKRLDFIGVGGQKQMGKDSVADPLANLLLRTGWVHYQDSSEKTELPWRRSAFAAPVKALYCQLFNKTPQFIEEWKERKECPPGMTMPVRDALTFIGDGFRKIQPDIWINQALAEGNEQTILSDARYLNEAARIRNRNGFVVLVYRHDKLNDDPNQSEAQIRPFLEWCACTGLEGAIKDWHDFKYMSRHAEDSGFKNDLASYDYFINNDGDMASLNAKVEKLADYIKQNYNYGNAQAE